MIGAAALTPLGRGLHRPECVLVDRDNRVYVPDWRGGVTRIAANGSQQTWLARDPPVDLRPNGIARLPDDSFLLANLGDAGGVWVDDAERAFATGGMRTQHLGPIPHTKLQHLTSVAFSADQMTLYLGSLHADCVYCLATSAM